MHLFHLGQQRFQRILQWLAQRRCELLANLASAAHGDAFPVPTLTDSVVSIRDWAKPPSAVTTLPAANTSLCSSKMQ